MIQYKIENQISKWTIFHMTDVSSRPCNFPIELEIDIYREIEKGKKDPINTENAENWVSYVYTYNRSIYSDKPMTSL